MGEFPSGQRGQTVNLLSPTSVVRIHLPPPEKRTCESKSFFQLYSRREFDCFAVIFGLRRVILPAGSQYANRISLKACFQYHFCASKNITSAKPIFHPCVKDLRKQVLFSTKFALRASEMRCAREILLRNVICLRVVSTRIESKTHIAEMIGVSPQSVSKWERGDTYPDITLLPALANLFKVLAILDKDMSQPEIEDAYLRVLHLGKKL